MSDECIYKRVMVHVLEEMYSSGHKTNESSPTRCMLECLNKFGLESTFCNCFISKNFIKLNECKNKLKIRAKEYEFDALRATCMLYKKLDIFLFSIDSLKMHPWWIFANKFPKMTKAVSCVVFVMCGSQSKHMFHPGKFCSLCASRSMDTPEHILME